MQLTKHVICRLTAAAVTLCLMSASACALDLSKPEDAYKALLRVVGNIDGKPVFKDWEATIFVVLPGEKAKPIMRMQGYNAGRMIAKVDGSYEWVTREVSYYQDLKTGEIIERWANPFNSKKVCVVQVANDPVSNKFPPPSKDSPSPFNVTGEIASLRWDVPLAYPNALPPADHPDESTGPTYLASEHFIFFANTADLTSDTQRSTPTHFSWFRTGPWLPWMKLGQAPGYLIYSGQGRKYDNFNQLPAKVKDYTLKNFPAYVTAPDSFYQPNETSWTYYAKLKKAGKLPNHCE
ncbi:MAG: DUF1838 family protein [Betaproteobacteria bacterium]|nr:DUF1838 family protein [Betaproteobacteria bacterium]